jgi:cobaltochelatase CobN
MHLLTTTSASLDDLIEPVDLGQPPGDVVVLSFADSDLTGLMAAWDLEKSVLPSVRLAHLRDLRHPLSVDLWIDRVAVHAKVIVLRLLGGLDWWRYGVDRLSSLARERGIVFAALPGEDRDDPRLTDASTLPQAELDGLLRFFREGGRDNLCALLRVLARYAGAPLPVPVPEPKPVARVGGYLPGVGAVDLRKLVASLPAGQPVVPIIFYRSILLAADTAPIDELCHALGARGLVAAPLVVPSLKESDAIAFVPAALTQIKPAAIITATAFAAGDGVFAGFDAPVLQVVIATTQREAWRKSPRGLGSADLAMHVVLPELDGRVLMGAVAFKDATTPQPDLAFSALVNRPEPDRIAAVADRVAALIRLQSTPRRDRRIAVLMPDYPAAPGRTGYAVGLDVPASVVALLYDLSDAGYDVAEAPTSSRALLEALEPDEEMLSIDDYRGLLADIPDDARSRICTAWGDPADDPDAREGCFRFGAKRFGNVFVALPPDRGRVTERRANYHDPALPPRHALVAFGLWLRRRADVHAIVHMGAHGTLEWLPGKAVALSSSCFPEIIVGTLPVIYPFIVSNPGEAAQAKRRIAAVTVGHLPPPLTSGELAGDARELERLVDEYAQADGLDRKRRARLARLIIATAQRSGLAREAGVDANVDDDEALKRIDAWLCDVKDLAVKDGLHVYGRAAVCSSEFNDERAALTEKDYADCAFAERQAMLTALDGKHVPPGPAGAPARGRRDVVPTGRNLYTADPRMLPTQTAVDLGQLAADEVIRTYCQTHGEMPRALVIDLWGSATLRTGGEEIAQGLALMGCRPLWDAATARVIGVEVLPIAAIGRSRVDVTWRISGLFRDLFPAQIALIDAAVHAVAAREESDDDNPLVVARGSGPIARVFGTAPGAYGAGVEDLAAGDHDQRALGEAYLAATSHAYAGAAGEPVSVPGAFAARVAAADLLVHTSDDPGRDLLEGSADVSFVGGFAAAAKTLGRVPDLIVLDATDPQRPRARPLAMALARTVRGRAINPNFIAGQMRHGPRGAAELAETVDRLVAFAEMTEAVPSALIDLVYDAYLTDPNVRAFLLRENPAAAEAIAKRFADALRGGRWHPRRNDITADLTALALGAPA